MEGMLVIGISKEEMESIDKPDPTKPIKGTASSMAVHEFGIKIKNQQSQFSNSFTQSF